MARAVASDVEWTWTGLVAAGFGLVEGTGHDLPRPLSADIVAAIVTHCSAAEAR